MAAAEGIGAFWYYVLPIRRRVALENVHRALGQELCLQAQRRIVRRSMIHACMYAIEELRMPDMSLERSVAWVAREHIERIDRLLARQKGVIAVTAHLGNFELMGSSQTIRGYNISAILKDIHFAPAQAFWNQVRTQTRLGQIAPRKSKHTIVQALADNTIVAMLIDQHMAPHRSVVCQFFGQPAATSFAPVRFALETGAPILPLFIRRTEKPGHHIIHFEPEFELEHPHPNAQANLVHNTQRLNNILEGWIRTYPDQWLWLHKRWKVQDNPANSSVGAANPNTLSGDLP